MIQNEGGSFLDIGADLGIGADDNDARGNFYRGGFDSPWGDYNNDGSPDLFTCEWNAGYFSYLFENNDGSRFLDKTSLITNAPDMQCYTASFGDYDYDGKLDLFIGGTTAADDKLYHNDGNGFSEVRASTGIERIGGAANGRAYCSLWLDFDNDGDLDMYESTTTGKDFLFVNKGSGTFSVMSTDAGLPETFGTACAYADYDQDGDLDILVGQMPGRPYLLHNRTSEQLDNHYLRVAAITDGNGDAEDSNTSDDRPAIGAKILVDMDGDGDFTSGAEDRLAHQQLGLGHVHQNEPVAHFGLGQARSVDLKVTFPDGTIVTKLDVEADQTIVVRDKL